MNCSGNSSSSRLPPLLALLACAACAARHGAVWPGHWDEDEPVRVAVLPPDNLAGRAAPERRIVALAEAALAREGIDVVAGAIVDEFLARHRIRDTSGLPEDVAKAARDELGVSGVLVTSIVLHSDGPPPRFGVIARLLSAADEPEILWMDGFGRTGDDAPGLLGLGRVAKVSTLEKEAFETLADSLGDFLRNGRRRPRCRSSGRFAPAIAFRSPALGRKDSLSIAVLPFVNESGRQAAGQIVSLQMARQLLAKDRVQVVEPGTLRQQMLEYRLTAEGGASLDTIRLLANVIPVDLVVGGVVRDYLDEGTPVVGFTIVAIDPRSEEVVWESTSFSRGDDAVTLFGHGLVSTTEGLTCRMARTVVDGMLRQRPEHAGRRS